MKDFNYYSNAGEYPNQMQYKTIYVYKNGKLLDIISVYDRMYNSNN